MTVSIQKICELFWQLEERYDLLDMQIDGVKAWQALRMHLYSQLAVRAKLFTQIHAPTSRREKLTGFLSYVHNAVRHSSLNLKARQQLIVAHPRSKKVDGQSIDIYTHDLEQELLQQGLSFYELDRPQHGRHMKARQDFRIPIDDLVLLRKGLSPLVAIRKPQHKLLREVNSNIAQALQTDLDVDKMLHRYAQQFTVDHALYARILDRVQPKEIKLVVSYGGDMAPLIAAAKARKIPVQELQHGNLSRHHLGYSFPGRKAPLDYFPDYFLAWNQMWKEAIDWPIDDDKVRIEPFRFLQRQKQKYAQLPRNDKQLVVISQGALGEDIAAMLLKHFARFAGWRIKYKLHPGEFSTWKNYPSLRALAQKKEVEILYDADLYKIFSQSGWQMGVYSTALYEGVEFGCQSLLLDLPGLHEHMQPFLAHHRPEILK